MATMKPCLLGVASVPPGSVLADDVCDAGGSVLLPRGSAVTEAHLQGLRRRGVESLCVLVAVAEDAEEGAARAARVEARIDHLFRQAGDNPAARDLRQRILDYRRRQA